MIDPADVTKFDRTPAELEEWWLFSTVVAGKTATTQARLLDGFLNDNRQSSDESPFAVVRRLVLSGSLGERLQHSRLGQYRRLLRCWQESLHLDLARAPVEAFEAVHGVGPKTARMFILHSRPDQRLAVLDTHVLKFLRASGATTLEATPSHPTTYRRLELAFLNHADAAGHSPADFDLRVWKTYATR
jgi:hypothetical protein